MHFASHRWQVPSFCHRVLRLEKAQRKALHHPNWPTSLLESVVSRTGVDMSRFLTFAPRGNNTFLGFLCLVVVVI